ncbi:DoxX family protein [Klebsiella pneumoniae]
MNAHFTSSNSRKRSKIRIISWVLQLIAAAFIAAGFAKLAAIPMMVDIFDKIGSGHWLRFFSGIVEITGGLALLIPATFAYGGIVLAYTYGYRRHNAFINNRKKLFTSASANIIVLREFYEQRQ